MFGMLVTSLLHALNLAMLKLPLLAQCLPCIGTADEKFGREDYTLLLLIVNRPSQSLNRQQRQLETLKVKVAPR